MPPIQQSFCRLPKRDPLHILTSHIQGPGKHSEGDLDILPGNLGFGGEIEWSFFNITVFGFLCDKAFWRITFPARIFTPSELGVWFFAAYVSFITTVAAR